MAAVARYLADTSALSRLDRPVVDAALSPLIEAGQVATCGVVELEVLSWARSPDDYVRRQRQLDDGFERLAMPDEVFQRALEVQAALATGCCNDRPNPPSAPGTGNATGWFTIDS